MLDLRDLQTCTHCGLCLQACPTYVATGQEAESPRGRIYLLRQVQSGRIGWMQARPHIDACMGCLGCQTACPSGVPYAKIIEAARAEVEAHARPWWQRFVRKQAISNFTQPARLRLLLQMARLFGMQRVPRWTARLLGASESVVRLPELPAAEWRPTQMVYPAQGTPRARVGLLLGCVMQVLFPRVHRATIGMLTLAGYEVHIPHGQGCCGALWVHNGYPKEARRNARKLFRAFREVDYIVVNAAGCGSTMKEYGLLFKGTPEQAEAEAFAQRVRDVHELLLDAELPPPKRNDALHVTYHDACHLAHAQGIREQPRALLRRLPNLKLTEMEGAEMCCGSAGIYNLLQPTLARDALQRKIKHIQATGATIVASANPGCTLWIRQGLQEAGLPVEVLHPVEILAKAYDAMP
ncbi:MAG: (Fe-S)-binding protein [Fimbriimonadales bacterium]|nr:(Fe-S)-binding protein [Fimbriimonadales bacterium]MDW8051785.1 (Fe-S)-binding protein [Armatimonadota bacterium]